MGDANSIKRPRAFGLFHAHGQLHQPVDSQWQCRINEQLLRNIANAQPGKARYLTLIRGDRPDSQLCGGAFASPVRPDNGDNFAARNREIKTPNSPTAVTSDPGILHRN
jgi:hypothetical protein